MRVLGGNRAGSGTGRSSLRRSDLWRYIIPGLSALSAFCAVLVLAGCNAESEPPQPPEGVALPDQEVMEFSLTETVRGSKSWTLFADRAEVFDRKGYSRVHGVKIMFYGPDGEVSSVLTSLRGRVTKNTKDLEAFGQVVVETSDGVKLETESLKWDNRAGRIWSSEFVTVTRKREVLTGYGFDSDPDLTNVQIHDQVKISVREEAGGSGEGGR